MIKPGAYDNMNINDYHKDPALSSSGVKALRRNPAAYLASRQLVGKGSDAFSLGSAAHTAILEGDKWLDSVAVTPSDVLSKSGSRAGGKYHDWVAGQGNKTILTQGQADQVSAMCQSIFEHPGHTTARSILLQPDAVMEQSIFYEDPIRGFMCKTRPDIRVPGFGMLADIKTCIDASPSGFSKACAAFGYDVGAAFYLAGCNIALQGIYYSEFVFICIEKEPPYSVACYLADSEFIQAGQRKIAPVMDVYQECLETNTWPGYEDGLVALSLPRYAL